MNKKTFNIDIKDTTASIDKTKLEATVERINAIAQENLNKLYDAELVTGATLSVEELEAKGTLTEEEERELQFFKDYLKVFTELKEKLDTCESIDKNELLEKSLDKLNNKLFVRGALSSIKTFGLMNDKTTSQLVTSEAFEQELNGQMAFAYRTLQSPKGQQRQVTTTMALTYEGTERLINKKMNATDNAVYNAVATIYYYWKNENPVQPLYVTPQEVWRAMNGKKGNETPSPKQLEKVVKSLDKMRFTKFFLDISEEIKANYLMLDDERITDGYVETYLLKADKVAFETEKGRKIEGYKVTDEPILYTYNKAKDHVLWVDFELLDTSDTKNKGEYTTEFTTYLLQRIQNYINGYLNSNRILLETIYQGTGIEEPGKRIKRANCSSEENYHASIRKAQKRDRDTIEAIFNSWIDKKRLIKSFTPVKKGNTVIGYDLDIIREKTSKGNKTKRLKG